MVPVSFNFLSLLGDDDDGAVVAPAFKPAQKAPAAAAKAKPASSSDDSDSDSDSDTPGRHHSLPFIDHWF